MTNLDNDGDSGILEMLFNSTTVRQKMRVSEFFMIYDERWEAGKPKQAPH